ncbi:DUF6961 family protein [Aurantiacibacter rhizosphaerae]|uniref:DUF6961 family protein n=1 Tax=Aurantiacibacter rhizosphaerae TaxID=2691582 RepID=UPI003B027149
MIRDKEIWGMALWVERHHGSSSGHTFIADRIAELEVGREHNGVDLWLRVKERFEQITTGPVAIYGQPETWPH